MKRSHKEFLLAGAALFVLLAAAWWATHILERSPEDNVQSRSATNISTGGDRPDGERGKPRRQNDAAVRESVVHAVNTVERIKQEVYDLDVEYADELEKLERLGRVTDREPSELWLGEWASADDWKRRPDGFHIEQDEEGRFLFESQRDPHRVYTWDEENREFSWELDYYGKIVAHKARFVDDDVLLMMTISGHKVEVDIYERAP